MINLKEKKLLVKMNAALGQPSDPALLAEIATEEARLQQEQSKLNELMKKQSKTIGAAFADLTKDINKLIAEEKKKTKEEELILERFSNIITEISKHKPILEEQQPIIEEPIVVVNEVVVPEVVEDVVATVEPTKPKSLVDAVVEKVSSTSTPSVFVQPDPPLVERDIQSIQQKLKLLEGWVSKISMAGPGGGAIWLKDLDDVSHASMLNAADGQILTYDQSIKKWTAQDPADGGGSGYILPTASTTTKGGVKIDGATITIADSIISANVPVTDVTSIDNTVQISSVNGVHDLSVAASLSTSVDKVFAYVTNDDSVTIHKGQPVYLYRATGNRPSVILAKSTSDAYSAKTLGLASQDIAPGNPGWVQTQGVLTGVDTKDYAEGDTLYLSPTAGVMTNVKPYAPQHLVYMGVVVRANQGQGQIYIKPQNGYELDEIHDVNINHNVVLANGHTIVWNATNNLWENRSLSGLVGTFTSNNAAYLGGIAANQYAYANASSISWINNSPAPGTPFSTVISANNGGALISLSNGLPGLGTTVNWVVDDVGISFPNNLGRQTVPFVGNANTLGGIAADQYAYANSLNSYQTTTGLSANVAKLAANNTSYLGGIAANQYAYANGSNLGTLPSLRVVGPSNLGSNTFAKAGFANGDITLDNGGTDTPGLLMYYANNNNFGIDSYNGTFSVLSGQLLRFTNNLNESGGAVKMAIDTTGNMAVTGFVQPGAYRAGQVIKDTMLSNTDFSVPATTVATSTSDTDFISYNYTPVSASSYLIIHVHVADYRAASDTGGAGTDSYFSRIKVDGNEIVYARQMTKSNESFRTGALFPLTGRYTNSTTSAKAITVGVRRDSADDNITITNSVTALWMRITEIAR